MTCVLKSNLCTKKCSFFIFYFYVQKVLFQNYWTRTVLCWLKRQTIRFFLHIKRRVVYWGVAKGSKHRGHGNYDITRMWSKALNEAKAVVSKGKANRALSPTNATTLNTKLKLFSIFTDIFFKTPKAQAQASSISSSMEPRRLL